MMSTPLLPPTPEVPDEDSAERMEEAIEDDTFRVNIGTTENLLNSWRSKRFSKKHNIKKRLSKDIATQWSWTRQKFVEYGLWTVWAFALMVTFGSGGWAFPDGGNPSCSEDDPSLNKSMCGVINSFNHGSKNFLFLSSFILAGFIQTTRALWLTRRSAYCALCGATRNLLINLTTLLPIDDQQLFARWAVLGFELSVLKARMLIDSDQARDYLEASKLIVNGEWDCMVNGDRHTTVWYWIQNRAKQLKDQGSIDAFELRTICNAVSLSRDKANDLMSPIDRDQPPPYVFVCALLINCDLFFLSTSIGLDLASWMNDAGGLPVFAEPRLYCSIFILYLCTTIIAMLFDVCALLYNPFGHREFDVKHAVVGGGIRFLGMSLSNKAKGCDPKEPEIQEFLNFIRGADIVRAEKRLVDEVSGSNRNTLFHFMEI